MRFRYPDELISIPGGDDSELILEYDEHKCSVYIKAGKSPELFELIWKLTPDEIRREPVKVLGDAWERSYGDLEWKSPEAERPLPWYFAVSNGSDSLPDRSGRFTECFGVMTQPDAFCCWKYSGDEIRLLIDIRNGGKPLEAEGKTIRAADIVFAEYRDVSAFEALGSYCAEISPTPLKTDRIIYGSNNWYYAYGQTDFDEFIKDASQTADFAEGCENRPFAVVDEGWQINSNNPPWTNNDRFPELTRLSKEISSKGDEPGIWVRFLSDERFALDLPDEARRGKDKKYLDPTHPAVKEHIVSTVKSLVSSGFKLIKHDFSAYDILGGWGKDMGDSAVCCGDDFYDKSKTTAQVIKEFYRLILENAGECLILGCNTVSHLSAGSVHAYRTGDDTSGKEWARTLKMGVNTLAFRLCQNHSFYICDADCVGITGLIDHRLNREWLKLLSMSGTSLFVSCKPDILDKEISADIRIAFKSASRQEDICEPIDWMETKTPSKYMINGKEIKFEWE